MTIRSQCQSCWSWFTGVVRQCADCHSDRMVSAVAGEFAASTSQERQHPDCTCGHCKIIVRDGPPWMWMETVGCGSMAAAVGMREAL